MDLSKSNNQFNETSQRNAALMAGVGLVVITILAIFAEFYVFPSIIVYGNAPETAQNIIANKNLFLAGVYSWMIVFVFDILVAWALYVFMKPVNNTIALLTGWFRFAYSLIASIALLNLLTVWHLISKADYLKVFETEHLFAQIMLSFKAFGYEMSFGFVFFSIHLVLLGYLVLKSDYVPKIIGVLLIFAGVGYLIEYNLKPFLFPGINTSYLIVTFFGELIFMVWLLIMGAKSKKSAGA